MLVEALAATDPFSYANMNTEDEGDHYRWVRANHHYTNLRRI